jgi:hypothetical protein
VITLTIKRSDCDEPKTAIKMHRPGLKGHQFEYNKGGAAQKAENDFREIIAFPFAHPDGKQPAAPLSSDTCLYLPLKKRTACAQSTKQRA